MLIRDGDGGRGGGRERVKLDRAHWPGRPRRPWTAARTMEVLRRCTLAIAQQLVYYATAVSTAVLGQTQGQCPLHRCWITTKQKRSTSLFMISSGLTWGSSTTSLLLILPGPCKWHTGVCVCMCVCVCLTSGSCSDFIPADGGPSL